MKNGVLSLPSSLRFRLWSEEKKRYVPIMCFGRGGVQERAMLNGEFQLGDNIDIGLCLPADFFCDADPSYSMMVFSGDIIRFKTVWTNRVYALDYYRFCYGEHFYDTEEVFIPSLGFYLAPIFTKRFVDTGKCTWWHNLAEDPSARVKSILRYSSFPRENVLIVGNDRENPDFLEKLTEESSQEDCE